MCGAVSGSVTSVAFNVAQCNCQRNHAHLQSAIPVSVFAGGQLWVENAYGQVVVDGWLGLTCAPSVLNCCGLETGVIVACHRRQAWRLSQPDLGRLLTLVRCDIYSGLAGLIFYVFVVLLLLFEWMLAFSRCVERRFGL